MLSPRFKPGVVIYGDHVVVPGGTKDNDNINDDIEVFNWRLAITQRYVQWQRLALTLPVPMWGISPTIVDEHLYIVGYTQPNGPVTELTGYLSIFSSFYCSNHNTQELLIDRQFGWSCPMHRISLQHLFPNYTHRLSLEVGIAEVTSLHQMYVCTTCQAMYGRKLHLFQMQD